jgi:hypothetical protein
LQGCNAQYSSRDGIEKRRAERAVNLAQFDWPAGFSHFEFSNSEVGLLSAGELGRPEAVHGCTLTQIRAHY